MCLILKFPPTYFDMKLACQKVKEVAALEGLSALLTLCQALALPVLTSSA